MGAAFIQIPLKLLEYAVKRGRKLRVTTLSTEVAVYPMIRHAPKDEIMSAYIVEVEPQRTVIKPNKANSVLDFIGAVKALERLYNAADSLSRKKKKIMQVTVDSDVLSARVEVEYVDGSNCGKMYAEAFYANLLEPIDLDNGHFDFNVDESFDTGHGYCMAIVEITGGVLVDGEVIPVVVRLRLRRGRRLACEHVYHGAGTAGIVLPTDILVNNCVTIEFENLGEVLEKIEDVSVLASSIEKIIGVMEDAMLFASEL